VIYTPTPWIVRYVTWWLGLGRFAQREDLARRAPAQAVEIGLHFGKHLARQAATEPGAEDAVVVVLVGECWGGLEEVGHCAWSFGWRAASG
jgi:hypothetical protein